MNDPDTLPPIDLPSPPTTILTLTKFHATLATLLLATTTTADRHVALVSALAYVHFWSATLGFAWWPVFHVLCLGLVGALVGDMVLVGLRVVEEGVVGGVEVGGVGGEKGGRGGGGTGNGYGWVWGLDQLVGVAAMVVVSGPLGLLVIILCPGIGWYLRRATRVLKWVFPYTASALWFILKWLLQESTGGVGVVLLGGQG
ncbi:predicted protein [Chaetomium globosum CBS 148.51]|uniref:Uncharacterized protein n=1 Tax=Chaetomium globosum (strain ATCC 6205 / CBS 148.51 / DSM 1962 / NBRC 6347 / NRRL 1970) TaxID=306901 RepID=Q2HF05_CHAGB|nr:uncharacterized protein CHGG_01199 [Chaetomium globosum CBS 148.51]EAQ92964.1 predicted protein [Chaetomium globosum CBS 148.51]